MERAEGEEVVCVNMDCGAVINRVDDFGGRVEVRARIDGGEEEEEDDDDEDDFCGICW